MDQSIRCLPPRIFRCIRSQTISKPMLGTRIKPFLITSSKKLKSLINRKTVALQTITEEIKASIVYAVAIRVQALFLIKLQ